MKVSFSLVSLLVFYDYYYNLYPIIQDKYGLIFSFLGLVGSLGAVVYGLTPADGYNTIEYFARKPLGRFKDEKYLHNIFGVFAILSSLAKDIFIPRSSSPLVFNGGVTRYFYDYSMVSLYITLFFSGLYVIRKIYTTTVIEDTGLEIPKQKDGDNNKGPFIIYLILFIIGVIEFMMFIQHFIIYSYIRNNF